MVRGTEPDARITASPVMCDDEPSSERTMTLRSAWRVPVPANTVTFRLLSSPERPLNSPVTTSVLRAIVVANARVGADDSTPNLAASDTVRNTWAVSSSSFAGMQPRWRQVPPTLSFSITATFSPAADP